MRARCGRWPPAPTCCASATPATPRRTTPPSGSAVVVDAIVAAVEQRSARHRPTRGGRGPRLRLDRLAGARAVGGGCGTSTTLPRAWSPAAVTCAPETRGSSTSAARSTSLPATATATCARPSRRTLGTVASWCWPGTRASSREVADARRPAPRRGRRLVGHRRRRARASTSCSPTAAAGPSRRPRPPSSWGRPDDTRRGRRPRQDLLPRARGPPRQSWRPTTSAPPRSPAPGGWRTPAVSMRPGPRSRPGWPPYVARPGSRPTPSSTSSPSVPPAARPPARSSRRWPPGYRSASWCSPLTRSPRTWALSPAATVPWSRSAPARSASASAPRGWSGSTASATGSATTAAAPGSGASPCATSSALVPAGRRRRCWPPRRPGTATSPACRRRSRPATRWRPPPRPSPPTWLPRPRRATRSPCGVLDAAGAALAQTLGNAAALSGADRVTAVGGLAGVPLLMERLRGHLPRGPRVGRAEGHLARRRRAAGRAARPAARGARSGVCVPRCPVATRSTRWRPNRYAATSTTSTNARPSSWSTCSWPPRPPSPRPSRRRATASQQRLAWPSRRCSLVAG